MVEGETGVGLQQFTKLACVVILYQDRCVGFLQEFLRPWRHRVDLGEMQDRNIVPFQQTHRLDKHMLCRPPSDNECLVILRADECRRNTVCGNEIQLTHPFFHHTVTDIDIFGDVPLLGVLVAIHGHDPVSGTWHGPGRDPVFSKGIPFVVGCSDYSPVAY